MEIREVGQVRPCGLMAKSMVRTVGEVKAASSTPGRCDTSACNAFWYFVFFFAIYYHVSVFVFVLLFGFHDMF